MAPPVLERALIAKQLAAGGRISLHQIAAVGRRTWAVGETDPWEVWVHAVQQQYQTCRISLVPGEAAVLAHVSSCCCSRSLNALSRLLQGVVGEAPSVPCPRRSRERQQEVVEAEVRYSELVRPLEPVVAARSSRTQQ